MQSERYAELISEGRASLINGLVAYGTAFELLTEDQIDESLFETLDYALQGMEVMIPPMKSLYELDKKRGSTDEDFLGWLAQRLSKM